MPHEQSDKHTMRLLLFDTTLIEFERTNEGSITVDNVQQRSQVSTTWIPLWELIAKKTTRIPIRGIYINFFNGLRFTLKLNLLRPKIDASSQQDYYW